MSKSAAIIGAGQIGYAATRAFEHAGYDVRVLARSKPVWSDRDTHFERYVLGEDPAPQVDVVFDTIAYDAPDAARYDPGDVGQLILVSSASVYSDAKNRTLEKASVLGFPDFYGAIPETQPTVGPGPDSYSTRKIAMEYKARDTFKDRATILRPCAVHGPYSRHAREYWFVNRIKDRRRVIPLAFEGESTFHTTSAASIGALAAFLAEEGLGGVWNVADDDAPSVKEIGQTIAAHFGKRVRFFGMDGSPQGSVGRTPWSLPAPFELDTSKAREAGFEDFGYYAETVGEAIEWLRGLAFDDWRKAMPQLSGYPWDLFDYVAEDAFLDGRL